MLVTWPVVTGGWWGPYPSGKEKEEELLFLISSYFTTAINHCPATCSRYLNFVDTVLDGISADQ